jgi:agmatinase
MANNKQNKILNFDPSQPGLADASIFGLPFNAEESDIILIPVPWEVTVSYGSGASLGPEEILNASFQVDLLHQEFPELWKLGIYLDKPAKKLAKQSKKFKKNAIPIIEALESGTSLGSHPGLQKDLDKINYACSDMVEAVRNQTLNWLNHGKLVGLIGGDHSTPLGYYQALSEKHDSFGILHLDAHLDYRIAYEGFTYSHASIMYNALQLPHIHKIVSVGIRDFCEQEYEVTQKEKDRIVVFTDATMKKEQFEGKTWKEQCKQIIETLPEKVCVSFDIDGLMPLYCPNTGTPVPGGFSFEQAVYLLSALAASNKEIIGFDLVEVAPGFEGDWDGNVGARILFHLCGVLAKSQKLDVGMPIVF